MLLKQGSPLFAPKVKAHIFRTPTLYDAVLRQYCSTSYEGFVEWLAASSNVASWLGLGAAPHFMTLQKAAVRIGANLLHVMVGRFGCGRIRVAGMDASGFEDHHST